MKATKQQPSQSMSDFFNRADVRALQDIQKQNPPSSQEWKWAYADLVRLAEDVGAKSFFEQ